MKVSLRHIRFTYRVEEHHSFVHNFQVVGHVHKVILELSEQVINFVSFYLNYEGVRLFLVLGRNHQVVGLRDENFDHVVSVPEVGDASK